MGNALHSVGESATFGLAPMDVFFTYFLLTLPFFLTLLSRRRLKHPPLPFGQFFPLSHGRGYMPFLPLGRRAVAFPTPEV